MPDQSTSGIKYCLDTSVFVEGWRKHYPPQSFNFWDKISELIEDGRILLPREVGREIFPKKDEVAKWLKSKKKCICDFTKEQLDLLSILVNKYPRITEYQKPRSENADPYIVVLAKVMDLTVVTYEGRGNNRLKPKIPDLCLELGVPCIRPNEMIAQESWIFRT